MLWSVSIPVEWQGIKSRREIVIESDKTPTLEQLINNLDQLNQYDHTIAIKDALLTSIDGGPRALMFIRIGTSIVDERGIFAYPAVLIKLIN